MLYALLALVALVVYAVLIEPFAVRLRRVTMWCPRLPESFDGFTVLQISDVHMDKMGLRERWVRRLVCGLKPDVTAITGDLAGDGPSGEALAEIALGSMPRIGVFAISGNSDVRHPEQYREVQAAMRACGVVFLENERRILERNGEKFVLAGVEDPHTGRDDLNKALEGAPPETFTFLLAHAPSIAIPAIEKGVDCVISGHTHGGQIALPFVGPLFTRSGHGRGLAAGHVYGEKLKKTVEVDPGLTQIYVSRGIGASFLPIRFLSPPEVALFTLRRPSEPFPDKG